jgi:pre-mRNA-splicing factor CWC26
VDAVYKNVSRWGDPMAGKLKTPASFDLPPPEGFKVGGSGFKVPTAVPEHSWLRRNLGTSASRYNIKSGRHWDGVDRSNGYESSLFKTMSERQATTNAAYKWSVEDL